MQQCVNIPSNLVRKWIFLSADTICMCINTGVVFTGLPQLLPGMKSEEYIELLSALSGIISLFVHCSIGYMYMYVIVYACSIVHDHVAFQTHKLLSPLV